MLWGGALFLCALQSPAPVAKALVEPAALQRLRAAAGEIAKAGDSALIERMRAALAGLGDDEKELEKLERSWKKTAAGAKPGRSTRTSAATRLRRELAPLCVQLSKEQTPRRTDLARWIVELDSEQAAAQQALGRERDADGRWIDAEQAGWNFGSRRVAEQLAAASAFAPKLERGASENPALLAISGSGNVVRGYGIELHSLLSPDTLERILGQVLRAAVLSNALLSERAELPGLTPQRFVLLTSETQVGPALDDALASGGMTQENLAQFRQGDFSSFLDRRGWETLRWESEANLAAVLLWRLHWDWTPFEVQPCLSAGHFNWVSLRFLGASIPLLAWQEKAAPGAEEQTTANKDEALLREARWRAVRQSLWGCRSWMISQVRAGRDPQWARAMVDEVGKIRDESLLKTTLVCEQLQEEGRLLEMMTATGRAEDPLPAFEKALGEPLPEFEARWRRWLLRDRSRGLVQELEGGAAIADSAGPFAAALSALNQARSAALRDQSPEIPSVTLDGDLSHAAELHARYLTRNPAQKSVWPGAHHEYAASPGFTPEGSLAGGRSVIAFDGDPERSVHAWLGTFYHRLPLLSPGLFGVGIGTSEEVVVLDVGSLVLEPWKDHVVVWPTSDAKDVPRSFVPELPNPVPGADMDGFGYPVSLQLFLDRTRGRVSTKLELFAGEPDPKNAVECYAISPDAPLNVEIVPQDTWCLIPKRALAKKTRYTARAAFGSETKVWSFTTGD